MRLRRRITLAAFAVATPVIAVVGSDAASGHTECNVRGPHDAGMYTRNCEINSSRIGGVVVGTAYWHYKAAGSRGDWGGAVIQMKDRTGDGKCTTLKLKYRGPDPAETVVRKACDGKKWGPRSIDLNTNPDGAFGSHFEGVLSMEHCIGSKASTCIVMWRQKIGAKPPA